MVDGEISQVRNMVKCVDCEMGKIVLNGVKQKIIRFKTQWMMQLDEGTILNVMWVFSWRFIYIYGLPAEWMDRQINR